MKRGEFGTTGEAVILDPYRPYAPMLIKRLYDNHGVRTVCLHTAWRERLLTEGRYPILRSPAVSAHYMVPGLGWNAVAQRLVQRHDILGVLPYEEGMVYPLVVLAETLGLSWAQPGIQSAFRNKFALKALVAANDPAIRLNVFAKVNSADEALRLARTHNLSRYVLKPNSGSGNQQVAFFDHDAPRALVQEYFEDANDQVLLEEFVHGQEYWVNGQMDAQGQPTVTGIGQYHRINHNGVENLEVGTFSVSPDSATFAMLRTYGEAVMRATGLRRSPFHLEAIIDDRGPCLVEVGARFCGELGALIDMAHHGPQLDLIDVAAHYYISEDPYGPVPLDWDRVARTWTGTATGDSQHSHRLIHVAGVDAVEAADDFLFWIKRPEPGDFVHRTRSLTSRAWAVALQGPASSDPLQRIEEARATIQLSGTGHGRTTWRRRWPMYRGVLKKLRSTRPRRYQLTSLMRRLG